MPAIPCVLMRGGTSRGPYFRSEDLPSDPVLRNRMLARVMGSGHELQVDGIGGGHPLTSKIAIVSRSTRPDADVDYLFAQASVLEPVGRHLAQLRQHAGRRRAVRDRGRADPRLRTRDHGPHPQRQYRQADRGRRPDAGRHRDLRGQHGHRRRAGHRRPDPPGLPRRGRLQDRPPAADRARPRPDPGHRRHLHRHGDAAGDHARRRLRQDRATSARPNSTPTPRSSRAWRPSAARQAP